MFIGIIQRVTFIGVLYLNNLLYSVNGFVGLDCIVILFVQSKSIIPNMLKSNYTPQTLKVYQP